LLSLLPFNLDEQARSVRIACVGKKFASHWLHRTVTSSFSGVFSLARKLPNNSDQIQFKTNDSLTGEESRGSHRTQS